ncbi:MAG: hypothetical protein ACRCYP_03970 [Alphaproteobacteria bacterium]
MKPIKIQSETVQKQEVRTETVQKAILSKSEIEDILREAFKSQGHDVFRFEWKIKSKSLDDGYMGWHNNAGSINFVDSVEVVLKS